MYKSFIVTLSFIIVLLFTPIHGQVEYSGFFDIQWVENLKEDTEQRFRYGQFEIDPSVELSKKVSAEAALAFNPDEEKLELGAGFIDFHFRRTDEEHPPRGAFLTHTGLMVGQFDVPFGMDYQFIPSPDRKLVTPPLVNQKTIDSWNDMGVNLYGAGAWFRYTLFLLNGFYDDFALGGRILFRPLKFLSLGVSHASDRHSSSRENAHVSGVELSVETETVRIKSEYLNSSNLFQGSATEEMLKSSGYYFQVIKNLNVNGANPPFLSLRYGAWKADKDMDSDGKKDDFSRLTLGAGVMAHEGVEIRLEYINNYNQNKSLDRFTTVQSVISF